MINQEVLGSWLKNKAAYPVLDQSKLEKFGFAVFLLSYERGGGLGYSRLH
jgi:hypothetical protein